MQIKESFHAKILLFGEYSIIRESRGLAIPYSRFQGELKFNEGNNPGQMTTIDQELLRFVTYLKALEEKGELGIDLNLIEFSFDIGQGLFFDSSIPRGMGLGSSGALCAAVLSKYGTYSRSGQNNIISSLQSSFSRMESFFHGSSSGIDPLISFIDSPLLITCKGAGVVNIPTYERGGDGAIFLLNTGLSRRTEPLVNIFLEKCKNSNFASLCDNTLLPITENCISTFLEGEIDSLFENFKRLSEFQYIEFSPMIPNLYRDIWKAGLESDDYYLKLCGAGGGGYLLGITDDFRKTAKGPFGDKIISVIQI